jgi:CBS domain-containing protein
MLVKDVMNRDVEVIDGNISLNEAAKVMFEKKRGCLLVLESGKLSGIVTERDFVWKVVAKGLDSSKLKTREIMSSSVITVDPDTDLAKAAELMVEHGIRGLPVAKDGIIYGIIGTRHIVSNFYDYMDKVTRDLLQHTYTIF